MGVTLVFRETLGLWQSPKNLSSCWKGRLLKGAQHCFSFFFFFKFVYFWLGSLFILALGLLCCTWTFSSCSKWGLLFVVVPGLLITVSSLVEQRRESVRASVAAACGLSSWDTPALWPVESSRTRDWTRVPCTDRRIPAHCTTREVQHCFSIPRKSHDGLKYFPLHLLSLTNPLSDLKKIFSITILRCCFDLFLDEILWEKGIFSFFFLKQ